ncbi:EpsG family protein [Facklamia sp. P12934]|uniref:EpsG family protein n=1 Tax=Facklamia sp. P12934 TaxID=3421948 RepID=UPI003D16A352
MLDGLSEKRLDFNQIFNYGPYNETIITNIYFNLGSKFADYRWFQVFPAVLNFVLIFKISIYFKKNYNVKFVSIALYVFSIISVSSLLGLTTGIRQNTAWAFLAFSIFYDFFEIKKKNYISFVLYLIPVLIHTSTIPFIILRIILILIKKIPSLKYFLILWPISLFFIVRFDFSNQGLFHSAIKTLIHHETREYIVTAKFLVAMIIYPIYFHISFELNKLGTKNKIFSKSYHNYFVMVILFGMSSIMVPTLFERTIELLMFISLPFYSYLDGIKFPLKKLELISIIAMYTVLFYWQDIMNHYFF